MMPKTNIVDGCSELFDKLVMDYHETVISFDKRDYSYIRNYSLKLVLSEDATHYSKPFPMKQAECDIMNEQLAAM
jgi:hypothetical protein